MKCMWIIIYMQTVPFKSILTTHCCATSRYEEGLAKYQMPMQHRSRDESFDLQSSGNCIVVTNSSKHSTMKQSLERGRHDAMSITTGNLSSYYTHYTFIGQVLMYKQKIKKIQSTSSTSSESEVFTKHQAIHSVSNFMEEFSDWDWIYFWL